MLLIARGSSRNCWPCLLPWTKSLPIRGIGIRDHNAMTLLRPIKSEQIHCKYLIPSNEELSCYSDNPHHYIFKKIVTNLFSWLPHIFFHFMTKALEEPSLGNSKVALCLHAMESRHFIIQKIWGSLSVNSHPPHPHSKVSSETNCISM